MKIIDFYSSGRPTFSFEFFPPKTDEDMDALFKTAEELKQLNPSFLTVTYGAGGSTRRKTIEIVSRIRRELKVESMTHLTCVGHSRAEFAGILDNIKLEGIENVLALRGDPPKGETTFTPHPDGFRYAAELVKFIRAKYDFCLGVAGYPEKHPEAPTLNDDLKHLKEKVDAGGEFIPTQLFFDNSAYFSYVKKARAMGIKVPIVPGIMPITNVVQIKRFTTMCGASLPSILLDDLHKIESDPKAVIDYGVKYATNQCRELLAKGAPGIHFYTLNRSHSTIEIFKNLGH